MLKFFNWHISASAASIGLPTGVAEAVATATAQGLTGLRRLRQSKSTKGQHAVVSAAPSGIPRDHISQRTISKAIMTTQGFPA